MAAADLVEVWRGPFAESRHRGHAAVCDAAGELREAWGEPEAVVLPRSAVKMIQALPLVESGAGGLPDARLALACASHDGGAVHTEGVAAWLADLGLGEDDLRCGAHGPRDAGARAALRAAGAAPGQLHNNCSGKHAGFLALTRHLEAGPDYVAPDHPVQCAVREAFEDVTGAPSPGFGIDGCSAPNFAARLRDLARAMALFADAREDAGTARPRAMARLIRAMAAHPQLVAGEGRACTDLIRAMAGGGVVKTGAEGVFLAALPERGLGVALKIEDGASRAAECAIAAILVRLGAVAADDPAVRRRMCPPIVNWRGIETGSLRPAAGLDQGVA